jgi:hypothetical protein
MTILIANEGELGQTALETTLIRARPINALTSLSGADLPLDRLDLDFDRAATALLIEADTA